VALPGEAELNSGTGDDAGQDDDVDVIVAS
jgi:hypothetical protein